MIASPAGGVVHRQKKIVAAFVAAGATTPDRATTAAALGIHEGLAFRVLRRHGIVRDAADRRLYLDQPGWEAHQARRRRLAVAIPAVVLLVGGAILLWTILR